jgi:transcriptional regulator with XRE-family HTH domain
VRSGPPAVTLLWVRGRTVILAWRSVGCVVNGKCRSKALALAADIHPTYLSSIERGRRNPSWRVLSDLAGALEISVADLARRVESTERVREGVERVLEDERARLVGVSVGMVQDGAA